MYKKTITYTDYNGDERTEDFLFNMSKAEIVKMQMSINGGFDEYIKRAINTRDVSTLVKIVEELIDISYGEKSLDGKRFVKADSEGHKLSDLFKQTEAYSQLFIDLAFDPEEAKVFINGVFPSDLINSMKKSGELKIVSND